MSPARVLPIRAVRPATVVPRRIAMRVAAWLSLAAAVACASAGARAGGPSATDARVSSDSVVVRVANRSDRALAIAVARAGAESPLGDVSAGGTARFVLRAADVTRAPVALVATASHESMRTVPFRVRGGQVVWLEIMPGLVGSQVRVRWPEEGPPDAQRDAAAPLPVRRAAPSVGDAPGR